MRLRPERPNHVWAYDFVEDRTRDGRRFRMLNVVDEFTRECLAIRVWRQLRAADVIDMNLDYSPVPDESGKPAGVLAIVIETNGRVAAEAALRDERDLARNVLDNMGEAFAPLDRHLHTLDLNAEALRLGVGRGRP